MAQPTLSGLELNLGTGGGLVLHDVVDAKIAQVVLQAFSTGDGTLEVVMADAPLPVDIRSDNAGGVEVVQDTAADLNVTEASAADIKTAVEKIDDWDESDRAKVNPIVGQAGIAADAGVVGATVPRVTLASDDPAVAKLTAIDADTSKIPSLGNAAMAAAAPVTLASDDTLATAIKTAVEAIQTAAEILDNCISGTEAQVDVVAALPAGSNAIGKLAANSGVDIGDVDVTSVPAPLNVVGGGTEAAAQRVTIANDSTGVISVDDGGGALTVDGTVTETNSGAIKTAVELIDNAISGSEMQVDVVASLPAGTNAIGKLASNTGVDIGDVDVTSVVPGTGATNLGKAEDAAHVNGDTGVMPLAVRNDDLAALAGADGDYAPVQVDANGAVFVNQAAAEIKQASGVAAGGAPGTDDMIAAVAGKKILVLALGLFATSATTNSVYVDNADNDLLFNAANPLALSLDADGDTVPGFILPFNPGGWFKTDTVNEAITLNSSAAQDIAYTITYIETD